MISKLDDTYEGQMTLYDLLEPPEEVVAVSRTFARARKQMTLCEWKCFVYGLTKLRFTENPDSVDAYTVLLDKKVLAKIFGISNDYENLSKGLYRMIKDLTVHSRVEFNPATDKAALDREGNGFIITDVVRLRNWFSITFNHKYRRFFTGLLEAEEGFLTLWTSDIFSMENLRSVLFYEYLRQCTDSRLDVNCVELGVRALKDLFEIPKDGKGSYMRDKNGFDRTNFERHIICPLCADLSKTKMITLVMQADGRYFEKVKSGNRVQGYRFYWTYTKFPVPGGQQIRDDAVAPDSARPSYSYKVEAGAYPPELWTERPKPPVYSREEPGWKKATVKTGDDGTAEKLTCYSDYGSRVLTAEELAAMCADDDDNAADAQPAKAKRTPARGTKTTGTTATAGTKTTGATAKKRTSSARGTKAAAGNRFNNFDQRDYDFKALERVLIQSQRPADTEEED